MKKLLLEKANIPGILSIDVYQREGGYRSVEKAFKMSPNDIVEEVKKAVFAGEEERGFQLV